MLRIKLALAAGTVVVVLALWGYITIQRSRLETATVRLDAANAALEEQVRDTEQALDAAAGWEKALTDFQRALGENESAKSLARSELDRLDEALRSHDLEAIARRKPALVERRLDAAGVRSNRMLECATGNAASC